MRIHPLLIAAAALAALPFALQWIGLTTTSAVEVVIFAVAAMGLNLLSGYTGLVSFGHGAWFGLGAYAAALAARALPGHAFWLPLAAALAVSAVLAAGFGVLMLRRRGVYFSLMTLALSALGFTIAFRWTSLTGGENGLGGVERPAWGGFDLNNNMNFYIVTALIALAVAFGLWRLVNAPLGRVLEAIRENQTRAMALGFPVVRYKLAAFVTSASVTALAGALLMFKNRMTSAEPMSVAFSGELLAMAVIGGMRGFLGPALGALFYVFFREYLSMWTENWLFWFGLVFVGFVMFAPQGLVGIGRQVMARLRPGPTLAAAMADRRATALPLPAMLRRDGAPGPDEVLKADEIAKSFGGLKAVDGVSLTVRDRTLHALIGPNGAGKTTAFNLLTGMLRPDAGRVTLEGAEIAGQSADEIARQGIGRSFQITSLFPELTVFENVRLAVQSTDPQRMNAWRSAAAIERVNAQAREIIEWVGLGGMESARAGSLSYGGQRLLDLGLALATPPRILLADEPLAGLSVAERERVGNLIKQVSQDVPVLLVEHDIDRVFSLADHVTVMNEGKVLLDGDVAAARSSGKVQEIYIGSGTSAVAATAHHGQAGTETLCRLEGVNVHYGKSHILHDVGFDIRKGEILALLGRNGAGKSTLLKAMIGIAPVSSGTITLDGQQISGLPPAAVARAGVGYVPQGRGLFAGMTVRDNLELGRIRRRTGAGTHWSDEEILEYFPRLAERMETEADRLSGGEQQMADLLRDMLQEAGNDPRAAASVTTCDSMEQALDGVALVQESGPEVLEIKRELFGRLDAAAAPGVILASSSSALVASQFADGLAGAGRCIVGHPVNPPHVVPVVELCPSPQTEPWVLPRAEAIYRAAGQVPAVLNREIPGFVLNRLQAVLLAESLRLVAEGVCSVQALDDTMRHGLGRRWTLMGPLETISLNAPEGVLDYMRRYGPTMARLADDGAGARAFSEPAAAAAVAAAFPETDPQAIRDRTAWRDRELAALDRHLRSRIVSTTDKD